MDLPWDLLSMEEVPLMMVSERYRDLDLELSPSLKKKGLPLNPGLFSVEKLWTLSKLYFSLDNVQTDLDNFEGLPDSVFTWKVWTCSSPPPEQL